MPQQNDGNHVQLCVMRRVGFKVSGCYETVPQSVPVRFRHSAKCWSEWQDLNLRPPRPERGGRRLG